MSDRKRKEEQKLQKALSVTSDIGEQVDIAANLRGWFGPADDSSFYPLVQSYVKGDADLEATIAEITKPIDAALVANRLSDINFMDLWYSILHSAKRLVPDHVEGHVKLVELVRAFKEHPEPDHPGDRGIYDSLTDFYMASRESMNDSPGFGAGYSKPEVIAYTNLNSFFARITREGLRDFWMYCIWGMRDALEEELKDDGPDDAHRPGTAVQKYDALVPAAASWVFVLGEELYEKEEDRSPTNPNQGNSARGGALWKGKPEFSKERWAFWKKRFGEVSEMEEVSEETRNVAKQAVDVMIESEKA
jgi:hypothetical protein